MSDSSSNHQEIRKFPPGFVYHPVSQPPASPRELRTVQITAWTIAILVHILAFFASGYYIDLRSAEIDVQVAWSDSQLTGFGMMDEVEDWQDEVEELEPPPVVEAEEDPFEEVDENAASPEPALDPDSIVIPEPEVEEVIEEEAPAYDLSRDKKRLNAVRDDVKSIPNLHVLAPGNAKLIVLIRNDRVIDSPFEDSIRRLYRAFPDYRFTLGASNIDPVRDIQAMLIATANPALYAETFLVVSHNLSRDALKKYISASFPTKINWQEHNGNPIAIPDSSDGKYNPRSGLYKRSLYLPDDHTVLFLRPEVLPTLDVAHVDSIVQVRDAELENSPEQAQTFLESLGAISASDSASMPTLFMMIQGIQDIRLGGRFPAFEAPQAVIASLSTAGRPHLNMEASFSSAKEAKQFVDVWPDITSATGGLGIPGLGSMLDGLALAAENDKVLITGDLNGLMVKLMLGFGAQYLERNN